VNLCIPISWLEGDNGRQAGAGEIPVPRPLQVVGEAVHVFGDNLFYEGGVFSGDGEECENLQAAILAGPDFRSFQCQFGELLCLYSFVGVAQIECGLIDVLRHIGMIQVEELPGMPPAVDHIDCQFDGEEGGHFAFLLNSTVQAITVSRSGIQAIDAALLSQVWQLTCDKGIRQQSELIKTIS
jgi:hypothetical protein